MNEGSNSSDWRVRTGNHEEGMSAEHLQVRTALQQLPLRRCPVGFEFRLQKKLEGGFVSVGRESAKGWTIGWAGLGMGVATAAAIAIFAFDFSGTTPVINNSAITATPAGVIQTDQLAVKDAAVPSTVNSQKDETVSRTVIQSTPQVAQSVESKAADARKDSLDKLKVKTVQDFPTQTVGTNPQPR